MGLSQGIVRGQLMCVEMAEQTLQDMFANSSMAVVCSGCAFDWVLYRREEEQEQHGSKGCDQNVPNLSGTLHGSEMIHADVSESAASVFRSFGVTLLV